MLSSDAANNGVNTPWIKITCATLSELARIQQINAIQMCDGAGEINPELLAVRQAVSQVGSLRLR